jgi:hypothetical protein
VLPKAKDSAAIAAERIDHFRHYFELLLQSTKRNAKEKS